MGFQVEKHKLRDDFGVPHVKQPQSGQRAGAQNWILQNLTLCKRSHHSKGIFEVFHGTPHLETKHDKTHVGQIQLPSTHVGQFPNSFQQIQSLAVSTKVAPFAMALGHRAKNSMMGRSTPLA